MAIDDRQFIPITWGWLQRVTRTDCDDVMLVAMLADWRDRNAAAFPTRFPKDTEATKTWLRTQIVENDDRDLFLIVDSRDRAIGHIGFSIKGDCEEFEIENVVRGVPDVYPGIMGRAMEAMIRWIGEEYGPPIISLRVLEENAHAIRFYRDLGFVVTGRTPLVTVVDGERTSLVPTPDAESGDAAFIRMEYRGVR